MILGETPYFLGTQRAKVPSRLDSYRLNQTGKSTLRRKANYGTTRVRGLLRLALRARAQLYQPPGQ
jgi:hypothetical protein